MGWLSIPLKLSNLEIDVSKDWAAEKIENLGAPDSDDDASRRAVRTATLVVAANDSSAKSKEQADYVCNGADDHIEIQAALDALPATGGEVKLLDGHYNCEVQCGRNISNLTFRGCGRNTILTTSTPDLVFLSFVGTSGAELTGIVIADLQIDGGAVSDAGIYFDYVNYSFIQNVYSRRHGSETGSHRSGISLRHLGFSTISGNTCQGNTNGILVYDSSSNNIITGNTCQGNNNGIYLYTSSDNNTVTGNTCQGNNNHGIIIESSSNNNTISGNTCQGNTVNGITLYDSNSNNTITGNTCQENTLNGIVLELGSNNNTVTGNTCQGNGGVGIWLDSSNNTISGNTCKGNTTHGIVIYDSNSNTITSNTCQENGQAGIYFYNSHNNTISGNTCVANSQDTTNTYDDIYLYASDYNNIQGNTCRAGALAKKPRYGINIFDATCDGNLVTNNDLYNDGFGTGSFNDAGTATVTTTGNRT